MQKAAASFFKRAKTKEKEVNLCLFWYTVKKPVAIYLLHGRQIPLCLPAKNKIFKKNEHIAPSKWVLPEEGLSF